MKIIKRLTFVLPLLLCGMMTQAQSWDHIGNGIGLDAARRIDVEVYNNELYVSELMWTHPGTELRLKKWDGQTWTNLPTYTAPDDYEFGEMAMYQGEIYAGMIRRGAGTACLIKFDGTQWVSMPLPNVGDIWSVRSLEVHNGALYIGGLFDITVGGTTYENMVKFDGVSITGFPGLTGGSNEVADIYFHNGTMYCKAGNTVMEWNGTSFSVSAQMIQFDLRSFLIGYNNELYCAANVSLHKISGGASTLVKTFPYKITDMDVMGGELYIVGDTLVSSYTLGGGLEKYDGQNFTTITAPDGLHSGTVFKGELHYFSGSVTMYNGAQYDRAFKMNSTLGIDEDFAKKAGFSVYPNPAQNVFYIENSVNEEQNVQLIDATGRVIQNISLQPETKAEVRTESLAPGMYFINNEGASQRVIIAP